MKHMMVAAAALALFAMPTRADAQDPWIAQVHMQLGAAAGSFFSEGFESTHDVVTGELADGETEAVDMQLDAGVEYMIMGVCDEDCPDLDLELLDPAGNVVAADFEQDEFPIVTVTPRRSGIYTVDVSMAACSVEPCRYGLGIYGR